jgi:hypothetical protein
MLMMVLLRIRLVFLPESRQFTWSSLLLRPLQPRSSGQELSGSCGRILEVELEQVLSIHQTLRQVTSLGKLSEWVKCVQVMAPSLVTYSLGTFQFLGDIRTLTRATRFVLRSGQDSTVKSAV